MTKSCTLLQTMVARQTHDVSARIDALVGHVMLRRKYAKHARAHQANIEIMLSPMDSERSQGA